MGNRAVVHFSPTNLTVPSELPADCNLNMGETLQSPSAQLHFLVFTSQVRESMRASERERGREREREREVERHWATVSEGGSCLQAGSGRTYKRQLVFLLSTFDFCYPSPLHLRLHLSRMSWDSYITNLTDHCMIDEAAIWGKTPGQESQWAASAGLTNITAAEIKRLVGDANSLRCNGPTIGGMKCMFIRENFEDNKLISIELKSSKNEQGETRSVSVGFSNTALVIAKGSVGSNGGTVANQVFKIADYLRKSNI